MTLSIRARLTLWYCSIVVAVLATGAVAGSFAQQRLSLQRLDDDLARTMATLEGVMRNEFGEGLSLEDAASEASIEVVVPDRTLVVSRADGTPLRVWGVVTDGWALPPIGRRTATESFVTSRGDVRVLTHQVEHADHRYLASVIAPLAPLEGQHEEMSRAMLLGVIIALVVAAAGGWAIGWATLRPLTRMAEQARQVNARDPRERLAVPPVNDELGRLAASFNELLDRLSSALNFQRQFMADASHELRTPVSVVRTAAQVTLAQSTRPADEYRESMTIIGEQANRLSRLVDAMFLLSRAEADGVPLRLEFLNLDDVLAECVRALGVLARERGIAVTAEGSEEVGLTADDTLLRQMIGNLLDNAIRHADSRVTAALTRHQNQVRLRITNDGPGIAEADRERIFDRFVRVGASDGAGLGLPIARWIAEAHAGTLNLASSAPGSTTFVVMLPLEPVSETAAAAAAATITPAPGRIADTTPAR
jgi:two-component system, OmpR family, sensor kinase